MPRPKTTDAELFAALTELFRDCGYEGASLSRISEATGLQRASLYHRFPGGKHEMALAVLRHVHERFAQEILAPLEGREAPSTRVRKVARKIDAFYEGGQRACLFDTLSLGGSTDEVRQAIAGSMQAVAGAFAQIAQEAGHTPARARRRGRDALVRIQGALVVARVSGDCQAFQAVVRELPKLLTGPA